ncbi:MAG TPA: UDP-N-acetylmuramate dehydrogenase [Bacteroidota bacterium]|nr:UDP-N-acetylmuramate dehydrogenase [Bacteroidota bacterium]
MMSFDNIKRVVRGNVAMNEPLGKYTSMRVGGSAECYIEPSDKTDMVSTVRYLQEIGVPYMVIGRGSNLVVSDEGVRGAVINMETGVSALRLDGPMVYAESGVRLNKFVDFCIQNSRGGVEMLAGIPGTVGGAVVMNAGAHGGEISDHIVGVEVLRDADVRTVPKADAQFAYRKSGFVGDVVLSATFDLPFADKEELIRKRRELILRRNESQPLELPNSGSMFKNPANTFAARLIEQAGLKGKRIGDAQISEKHANFIVNLGNAKAADVVRLIELARRTVYQNTGIMLELEVKLLGFPQEQTEKAV